MSVLDFGLGLAGVPQATIDKLDASLPALERIAEAIKQAEPQITILLPILQKIWPDVVAITPLARELIAFAKQKESN